MKFESVNIFPTTLYVGEIENHSGYKKIFYDKVYHKFQYKQINPKTKTINPVSENVGNPLIHLEEDLDSLFGEVCGHIKNYLQNVLNIKDIFDVAITKTWLSRAQKVDHEIPPHIHSPSHISFVYYLNVPDYSHSIQFSNQNSPNSLFPGIFADDMDDEKLNMVKEYNDSNSEIFYILPQEGTIILFPSKLPHATKSISNEFKGERLGISGDVTLILKEEYLSFSRGHIHEKYWKKYK
jgi:hypothetical protein